MKPLTSDDVAEKIAKTEQYCSQQKVDEAISRAKLAHQILDQIIARIKPGVLESDIKAFAMQCFAEHGIERTWHPPYIRFGENTLLTFMDKAKEDKILQENDIAFVDIGIVKDGIEGDAGRTVAYGDNGELSRLMSASRAIFDEAVAFWKRTDPTGIALYDYIYGLAAKMDVKWNLDPAGHLIGAFPHRGWKRGINHFPEKIENGKWILEIQLCHPTLPFGSFYEDLLYV